MKREITRDMKSLLLLLKDRITTKHYLLESGLCMVAGSLYENSRITRFECELLGEYLMKQVESLNVAYCYEEKPTIKKEDMMWAFIPGELEPRLEWLDLLIENY